MLAAAENSYGQVVFVVFAFIVVVLALLRSLRMMGGGITCRHCGAPIDNGLCANGCNLEV